MKRLVLIGLLGFGQVQALDVNLRPQGELLSRTVENVLLQLSTKEIPVRLNKSAGTTLTVGGVGVSEAPFNPDLAVRVVLVSGERRLEFNPQSPIPLVEAVQQALIQELGLKAWTAAELLRRLSSADLNGDNLINLADLAILMENYGKSATQGDLNQDRKVDDADVKLFMAQYSKADTNTRSKAAPKPPTPSSAPAADTDSANGAPAQPSTAQPSNTAPPKTEPPKTEPPKTPLPGKGMPPKS